MRVVSLGDVGRHRKTPAAAASPDRSIFAWDVLYCASGDRRKKKKNIAPLLGSLAEVAVQGTPRLLLHVACCAVSVHGTLATMCT